MILEHSFTVPVGIDEAWLTLLDIETIAPCMPGAALDSIDGDNFTGIVKVKLGPIGLTYKGKASFIEKDEAAHKAVIDAQGRDARGNGTAKALVTATLKQKGASSTEVVVTTDLNITGKPAQFGRGVMADVGNKLIGQFADCLSGKLTTGIVVPGTGSAEAGAEPAPALAGSAAAAASSASSAAASSGSAPSYGSAVINDTKPKPVPDVQPIDLLGSAGPAVAKRLIPVAVVAVVAVVAFLLGRRAG